MITKKTEPSVKLDEGNYYSCSHCGERITDVLSFVDVMCRSTVALDKYNNLKVTEYHKYDSDNILVYYNENKIRYHLGFMCSKCHMDLVEEPDEIVEILVHNKNMANMDNIFLNKEG